MSILMNLFIIIVGDSFEMVQETHKFNWLTDERVIMMDKSQREFDETSSESTSTDSDENPDLDKYERPLKKKIKSVRALKQIIEQDYKEWNGGLENTINEATREGEIGGGGALESDGGGALPKKVDMMLISQEEQFEMNIAVTSDGKTVEEVVVTGAGAVEMELSPDMLMIGEDSPSASSEDIQEEFDREYTRSFQQKVPSSVKDTFFKISKLKTKLRKEVDRCVNEVAKDVVRFNLSVRGSVNTGLVNQNYGDKSLK